jgi:hypothetical protein
MREEETGWEVNIKAEIGRGRTTYETWKVKAT